MKKQFERLNRIECEILKISTKGLDIKLYSDVDSRPNGFYTLENIPPKYISILPKEEYRKHWKGILESKKENNIFVRFGGLSKVRYDKDKFSEWNNFHIPPVKNGVYAFPIKSIEPFLFGWKKNWELQKKEFKYEGNIWHHLGDRCKPNEIISRSGTWVLTTFDIWKKAYSKQSINDKHWVGGKNINEPTVNVSKDHYEVFISDKI